MAVQTIRSVYRGREDTPPTYPLLAEGERWAWDPEARGWYKDDTPPLDPAVIARWHALFGALLEVVPEAAALARVTTPTELRRDLGEGWTDEAPTVRDALAFMLRVVGGGSS